MAQQVPFIVAELGTEADPFKLHIYAVFAERERAIIAARTKDALAAMKERRDRKLGNQTNLSEASLKGAAQVRATAESFAANVLPIVRVMQAAGATSLMSIADELNTRGVAIAKGGRWYLSTVRNLLQRGLGQ